MIEPENSIEALAPENFRNHLTETSAVAKIDVSIEKENPDAHGDNLYSKGAQAQIIKFTYEVLVFFTTNYGCNSFREIQFSTSNFLIKFYFGISFTFIRFENKTEQRNRFKQINSDTDDVLNKFRALS